MGTVPLAVNRVGIRPGDEIVDHVRFGVVSVAHEVVATHHLCGREGSGLHNCRVVVLKVCRQAAATKTCVKVVDAGIDHRNGLAHPGEPEVLPHRCNPRERVGVRVVAREPARRLNGEHTRHRGQPLDRGGLADHHQTVDGVLHGVEHLDSRGAYCVHDRTLAPGDGRAAHRPLRLAEIAARLALNSNLFGHRRAGEQQRRSNRAIPTKVPGGDPRLLAALKGQSLETGHGPCRRFAQRRHSRAGRSRRAQPRSHRTQDSKDTEYSHPSAHDHPPSRALRAAERG